MNIRFFIVIAIDTMVKIPIEIIEYMLDWVDYRSAYKFSIAARIPLERYLRERIRNIYNESMRVVSKINYSIEVLVNDRLHSQVLSIRSYSGRKVKYMYMNDYDEEKMSGMDCNSALRVYNCKFAHVDKLKQQFHNHPIGVYTASKIRYKLMPDKGEIYDYSNSIIVILTEKWCQYVNVNYGDGILWDLKTENTITSCC